MTLKLLSVVFPWVAGGVGGFVQSLARVTDWGGRADEGAVDLGELMMLR